MGFLSSPWKRTPAVDSAAPTSAAAMMRGSLIWKRMVSSVAGQVATHDAWTVNISATLSTVLLIAGDPAQANLDATMSSRSTVTTGEVGSEMSGVIDPLLSTAGNMNSNIAEVNETTVTGDGSSPTWGPA